MLSNSTRIGHILDTIYKGVSVHSRVKTYLSALLDILLLKYLEAVLKFRHAQGLPIPVLRILSNALVLIFNKPSNMMCTPLRNIAFQAI